MTSPSDHSRSTPLRTATALAALALALAACGGDVDTASPEPLAADIEAEAGAIHEPSATVDDRQFTLWSPGDEAAVLAEQRQTDPQADGSEVRLIVRLNPAAVLQGDRVATLGHTGNGESGDAAALRASQLAAKVSAVASTARAVVASSVLQAAPGAVVRQQFSHAVEGFVLTVPWGQAAAVADALARNPAVDAVEPDRVFSVGQSAPGVRTLDARAWGVDRIDQRASALDGSFRQTLTGSGVSIYVLDTGINPHNEFGSRLAAGYSTIQDGRGTRDCHGHGTHVAGTAAGATLGVAPAATVVPVRVMDCAGSSSGSSVLAGMDWVAAHGARPGVVNMSLGGSASSTLDAAAQRLMTAGFSVVAAAGNSNVDACTQSPARAAGLVTVAASDRADAKATFSNWGACVALWAPGTAIASAGHSSATAVVAMNGTSMAAPHASGAVALLLQGSPALAPAQVRQQLLAQASANTVAGAPGSMTRSLLYAGLEGAPATGPTLPVPVPVPTPAVAQVQLHAITMSTSVPSIGAWKAAAAVRVVDARGQAVRGAKVAGRYSHMSATVSCTTAADGSCSLASAAAPWSTLPVLGFAVTGVTGTQMAYTGGGARSAQVVRPNAPVARVTALTGTMVRSSPTAATWSPQFLPTIQDERGTPVAGATVQAVMQVHAGARVVGLQMLSCKTGTAGQCKLAWSGPSLNATHTGAVVQVLGVQRSFLAYQPGAVATASVGRTN